MLLHLDFSSDVPIYRQIRDQIVLGIANGQLRVGEKLPTLRGLANEAGINMMTVGKAYGLLKQEGYITTDRRGGTVVAGGLAGGQTGEPAEGDATVDAAVTAMAAARAEKLAAELELAAAGAKLAGVTREKWLELCGLAYGGTET